MQIIINDKTYVLETVKARILRKAVAITEEINFENLKQSDLDKLVGFVVEAFGSQFTIDDLYDGLDARELIPTIMKTIQYINGSMEGELEKFPK